MTAETDYYTPEGFYLARPLLLPEARAFSDVLTYVREWDFETMNHKAGKIPRPELVPAPRKIAENELGPYCSIDLGQFGGPRYRGVAVVATDAVIEAVRPRIVTPDDHLSFRIVGHRDRNRALVVLSHGYIIGSHWLAYIDPATIPGEPS